MNSYRIILTGLGNVGRSVLAQIQSQRDLLAERYGIEVRVVGVADSGGAALDPAGLDLAALLAAKTAGQSAASLAGVGRPGVDALTLVGEVEADLLLEATLTNLRDGMPGLAIIRAALGRGLKVVSANKGPIVLAYDELYGLSDGGARLRFSACVGGALPSVNIGRRDLAGTRIERIEGVLNGTTQLILRMMEQEGSSFEQALAEAQRRGLAEADPSLDVDGWDAANKLVILANAVLRRPTRLADLSLTGIRALSAQDLQDALAAGERLILLCLAERDGDDYRLSVEPTRVPLSHPLGRMAGDEMGIVYHTDIAGRSSATSAERGPGPTAAAMLRDLLDLVRA